MKKFCISFCLFLIIFLLGASVSGCDEETNNETGYLRIHVKANSNVEADQTIKYEVKDLVVGYLTPKLENVADVGSAIKVINEEKSALNGLIEGLLTKNGFEYGVRIEVVNEYFPTRAYNEIILDGGYYDAVMIYLGNGEGNNWWCVVYPPLCFTQKGVKYKSLIAEYIEKLFG